MALNLKELKKRAKKYVELEANTKVLRIKFAEKFVLFGNEDIALSVSTTDKKDPNWWVIGGTTPINLYSKNQFKSVDEAFSFHSGIMMRLLDRDFQESDIEPKNVGYDAFICHASEDKEQIVRPLAKLLTKLGLRVWFDEFELKVGDSLRRSIDKGLINSRFGIVILSKSFFQKNWTQYELDGLTAKEIDGVKVILPIWHAVTKRDVMGQSPTLADKVALDTSKNSIKHIAKELFNEIIQ